MPKKTNQKRRVPSKAQIKRWKRLFATNPKTGQVNQYPALEAHMQAVHANAVRLARALVRKGIPVNVPLLSAAAEAHDMVMPQRNFYPWAVAKHERIAQRLLEKHGFHEVGRIVGGHGDPGGRTTRRNRLEEVKRAKRFADIETQILDYVDSRTMGDQLVSLDEKLRYVIEKYGNWGNLPPHFKKPEDYIAYITAKFAELKRFEEGLRTMGINLEKLS